MNEKNYQTKKLSLKEKIPVETICFQLGFETKLKDGQKKLVKTFKALSKPAKNENLQKTMMSLIKDRKTKREKKKVGFKKNNKLIIKSYYNFGFLLKSISIIGPDISSFTFSKEKCVPFSTYSFFTTKQPQSPKYRLVSNLIGNQYVLFMENQSILTILFEVNCGFFSKARSIRMFMLKKRMDKELIDSDRDTQTNSLDPFRMWNRDDMVGQIQVYQSLQVVRNTITGICCLPFTEKAVKPSVYNSILQNENGETMFEFYCIQKGVFEVKYKEKVALQFIYAFVIASLDFKLLVE